jgi:hypothetical protein
VPTSADRSVVGRKVWVGFVGRDASMPSGRYLDHSTPGCTSPPPVVLGPRPRDAARLRCVTAQSWQTERIARRSIWAGLDPSVSPGPSSTRRSALSNVTRLSWVSEPVTRRSRLTSPAQQRRRSIAPARHSDRRPALCSGWETRLTCCPKSPTTRAWGGATATTRDSLAKNGTTTPETARSPEARLPAVAQREDSPSAPP